MSSIRQIMKLASGFDLERDDAHKVIHFNNYDCMVFGWANEGDITIKIHIAENKIEYFGVLSACNSLVEWRLHITANEAEQLHVLLPDVAFRDDRRAELKRKHSALAQEWIYKNCLILDTETTGLGDDDEVVEISIIDAQCNVLMNSLVKPSKPIPPEATAIHGITNEMVATAPTWDQLHDQFVSVIANPEQPLVIYNESFDIRLLNNTARIYGIRPAYFTSAFVRKYNGVFCAMQAYAEFYGQWDYNKKKYKWQKLTNAVKQCGFEVEGAHRSLSDCQMTLQVLQSMAVNGGA